MSEPFSNEISFKFKPDYSWPEPGTKKECPRCGDNLELVEKRPTYYGKPWWCVPCQWQYSEDDLSQAVKDSREEE